MKSIKEKAKEYDRVIKRINANESIVDVSGREQFEAGANYVISCIEKEMLSCKEFSQSQLNLIMQFCEKLEATNKV